uniref:Transthyretin/hydroxyisourate hydrolase domain-containing protein n=1 Tax=Aegilops tauschii subsp. strangulata TaxID=200361 RepID=A0A453A103_AEGTS
MVICWKEISGLDVDYWSTRWSSSQPFANKAHEITGSSNRTHPPITTHVLDTTLGSPASGIEVHLEMWKDASSSPSFDNNDFNGWTTLGSSITNNGGHNGHLMDAADNVAPSFSCISFNISKYALSGFFPYVSIIFEIKRARRPSISMLLCCILHF